MSKSSAADDALAALEKELGGLSVGDADGFGGGEIEPDDDASTRTAVRYGDAAADPLFDDDDDGGGAAASTAALGALGALGGDGAALIAYLEQTAAAFEAESGAPDPELRAKIAQLRAALHGRSAEVEAQATSVAAAADAADGGAEPAVERLQQLCAENLESAESRLQHVESLLGDRDTVEMLAGMSDVWVPALAEAGNQAAEVGNQAAEPAAGEPKGEDRAENFLT